MASYVSPKNNLKHEREEVLGITMPELVDAAKSKGIRLTVRTISRVESGKGSFTRVTFTRLLNAINIVRAQRDLKPLSETDLFPTIRPSKAKV